MQRHLEKMIDEGTKFLVFAHHLPMVSGRSEVTQLLLSSALHSRAFLLHCVSPQHCESHSRPRYTPPHPLQLDACQAVCRQKGVPHVRIDGSTPAADRQAQVQRFQENDSVRVAVLGITAANAGITLTAASTVVFAEMCWTPGLLQQCEDRAHR